MTNPAPMGAVTADLPWRITADADNWNASHDGLGTSSYCGIRDASGKVVALAVAQSPDYGDPDCRPIAEAIVQAVNAALPSAPAPLQVAALEAAREEGRAEVLKRFSKYGDRCDNALYRELAAVREAALQVAQPAARMLTADEIREACHGIYFAEHQSDNYAYDNVIATAAISAFCKKNGITNEQEDKSHD
jgi:hypothetical protein